MAGFLPQPSGCQDVSVLPQIRVWCSLFFVVIFSDFLGFPGRVCSVVDASVCVSTIYRCGARHCSHRCNLPDDIPVVASLFVIFPSLNFPRPGLSLHQNKEFALSFFFWSSSSRRRAPWIALLDRRVIELLGVWMTQSFRRQSTSLASTRSACIGAK